MALGRGAWRRRRSGGQRAPAGSERAHASRAAVGDRGAEGTTPPVGWLTSLRRLMPAAAGLATLPLLVPLGTRRRRPPTGALASGRAVPEGAPVPTEAASAAWTAAAEEAYRRADERG